MSRSAAEIARETEQARSRLEYTLQELRHRMSPGQVLDEALDYARDSGGAEFLRNLGEDVRTKPLPIALIGAGIAWLLFGPGRGSRHNGSGGVPQQWAYPRGSMAEGGEGPGLTARAGEMARHAGESAGDYARRASEAVHGLGEHVREFGTQARDAAGNVIASTSETAGSTRDALGHAYGHMADSAQRTGASFRHGARSFAGRASAAGRGARDLGNGASDRFMQMLRDQPLLFGALGVAIGAAIGASFSSSKAEDRLMGDTSDAMKQRASELLAEGFEQASAAAERVYEKGAEEAKAQGLTPEAATASVHEMGEKLSAVAGAVKDGVQSEMQKAAKPEKTGSKEPNEKRETAPL